MFMQCIYTVLQRNPFLFQYAVNFDINMKLFSKVRLYLLHIQNTNKSLAASISIVASSSQTKFKFQEINNQSQYLADNNLGY